LEAEASGDGSSLPGKILRDVEIPLEEFHELKKRV
jgi:hypothetical protein